MKKRILLLVLCIACLLSCFMGCNSSDVTSITFEDDNSVSTVTDETETTEASSETSKYTKPANEKINMWTYKLEKGVGVRDLVINTNKGGEDIQIIQITDPHLSWVNETDLADETIKSTYDTRSFGRNGTHLSNMQKCLDLTNNADQIVITGDIYDYLTSEVINKVQEYIFTPYADKLMACLGNHEAVKAMGEENESYWNDVLPERMKTLEESWANDVYYSSKVLGEKVMLIQMDNGITGKFWDVQVDKFSADLDRARANGYAVLLFYHVPIATLNSNDINSKCCGIQTNGTEAYFNFCSNGAAPGGTDATGKICSLIFSNGDIIKGAFCGHKHSDFYTEIKATDPNGNPALIPQYILAGAYVGGGQIMRITVK